MRRILASASLIQFFLAHLNVLNCRATILLVAVLLTLITSRTGTVVLIIAWQSIIRPSVRRWANGRFGNTGVDASASPTVIVVSRVSRVVMALTRKRQCFGRSDGLAGVFYDPLASVLSPLCQWSLHVWPCKRICTTAGTIHIVHWISSRADDMW